MTQPSLEQYQATDDVEEVIELSIKGKDVVVSIPKDKDLRRFLWDRYRAEPRNEAKTEFKVSFWHADSLFDDLAHSQYLVVRTPRFERFVRQKSGLHSNKRLAELREIKETDDHAHDASGMAFELYPFQKTSQAFLQAASDVGLIGDVPGLGKTIQALAWTRRHPGKTLIICPAIAKYVWRDEIEKVLPGASYTIMQGRKHPEEPVESEFCIINFDILSHQLPYLLQQGFTSVVVDEAHYIKDPKAKRSEAALHLAREIPNRLCLTGTPMPNGPVDVFSILKFLYPEHFDSWYSFGERFGGPETKVRNEFRRVNGELRKFKREFRTYTGGSNLKHLHSILEGVMIRRKKTDVGKQLPPKTYQNIICELDAETRKKYDAMNKDFIGWLVEQGELEKAARSERAPGLTKMAALKQLVLETKTKVTLELVEPILDNGGKVIIFSNYVAPLDKMKEHFGDKALLIRGGVSQKDRSEAQKRFNTDDSIQVFLGQLSATKEALNLQAAEAVVFHDLAWSPLMHSQGEDRAHRLDSTSGVTVYYLACKDTVEEFQLAALMRKMTAINAAIDGQFDDVDLEGDVQMMTFKAMQDALAGKDVQGVQVA